ncbi:MAG TPA: magnesium transporter [Acidimicrobiia bacterium]|nr:magnesium transporter [Acidimicrobiia bacterium]
MTGPRLPTRLAKRAAKSPVELARWLRALARREPRQAEEYFAEHAIDWPTVAGASPEDAADILEAIGEEAAGELLADLSPEDAAELLEELRDEFAATLLTDLDEGEAVRVLDEMAPDEAADVLAEVSPEVAVRLLEAVESEHADEVRHLLRHDPESAGGLMTTDIAALPLGLTVGEAVERIRALREEYEDLSYVYVVDDDEKLVGVVSFRDLVFHRPGDGLDQAMVADPIAVDVSSDRTEAAELVQRYHLFGIPVVDHAHKLLGMITTESILETVQEEASEDFAVAVGTAAEDSVHVPVRTSIRHRLPWIAFDVAISCTVVFAISRFDDIIAAFVVLAALMPLVARIGGDAGAQTLAVVIRGLATDDIQGGDVRRVLARETTIGLFNGLVIGLLAGVLGYGLQTIQGGPSPFRVGAAMMLASWVNLILAGLSGAAIPLTLRRLGFDPALGSNLFLTTATDLVGFAGFLAVATMLL